MQKLEPQKILNDVSDGIISGVKWNLCPPNSVSLMINCVADEELGEAVVRNGSSIIGAQIAGSTVTQGTYQFIGDLGDTTKLLGAVNGGIYYWSGSVWTAGKTGLDADAQVEFETFLNTVIAVNGVDNATASSDGITWGDSNALATASMPVAKYVKVYKDQVVLAGVSGDPDTLHISSVPSSGVISWSTNNRSITINPEDGQNITGLGEISGLLLVFKDRAMYRWNNRSTDADEIVSVGCSSQKSIVNCGSALSFYNDKGFWLTSGEQPVKISRKIQKWIDGRTSTFDVASFGNEDYLYGSLGSCTVDGATHTGVVVRYSMLTKEWVVYKYPYEVRAFARYNDTTDKIVVGTSLSKVLHIEDGTVYQDESTDISFEVQTHDLDFGSRGMIKQVSERALGYCKNPYNTIIQVQEDGGDWKTLGVMNKEIENMMISEEVAGHYLRFRAIGISKNKTRFQGIELPNITILDYAD